MAQAPAAAAPQTEQDPVRGILDPLTGVDKNVKALAWDTFHQSQDQGTFKTKLDALQLPKEVKAKLWDAKYPPATPAPADKPRSIGDRIKGAVDTGLDWLPVVTGTVGGVIGGGSGAAAMGVGAVPGAAIGGGLGMAAGEGIKQRGKDLLGTRPKASLGSDVKDVAVSGLIGTASELGGAAFGAVGKAGAKRVLGWELAQIPKKVLSQYKTNTMELATTLLKSGVNVTKRGLDRLDSLIDVADQELTNVIGSLKGPILPRNVTKKIGEVAADFTEQVDPAKDLKKIQGTADRFMHHPKYGVPTIVGTKQEATGVLDARGKMAMHDVPVYENQTGPLTGTEAQSLKRGTYQRLKKKYGQISDAAAEAQKALARGLREEIETLAKKEGKPDVLTLNDKERQLLAAREAVAHRILSTPQPHPTDFVWIFKHPIVTSISLARKLGVPVASIVAKGLHSDVIPGVSPTVLRVLWTGLAGSGPDDTATPGSAGASGGSGGSSTSPSPGR